MTSEDAAMPDEPSLPHHSVAGDQVRGDQVRGDKVDGDKINAQGAQSFINRASVVYQQINSKPPKTPELRLTPRSGYIPRETPEHALRGALHNAQSRIIVLHGMSGSGKTWLAEHVVLQEQEQFKGGMLWASLHDFALSDLFIYFLSQFSEEWYHHTDLLSGPLRTAFWDTINKRGDHQRRILIVLDDVDEEQYITEFLPSDRNVPEWCHVLLVSTIKTRHTDADQHYKLIPLGGLDAKQAEQLLLHSLNDYLNDEQRATYHEHLQEIARRLGYLPLWLKMAARDIGHSATSPAAYVEALRQVEGQHHLFGRTHWHSIELVLADLTESQRHLFGFIGVLGEGSWPADMLATVALRHPSAIQHDLAVLVERDLVKPSTRERYEVNLLVYDFARMWFAEHTSSYVQDAATTCLAHYCLDRAQHLAALLSGRPDIRQQAQGEPLFVSERFVQEFRRAILLDLPHIRKVLRWAEGREDWPLLRRFAHVAHAALLKHPNIHACDMNIALTLATVLEPLLWERSNTSQVTYHALVNLDVWNIPERHHDMPEQGTAERHELDMDILIGQVIDGLFDRVCLFNTDWLGVRAADLILRDVEMVRCRFVACDLSQSVWMDCTARHVALLGSNLSYALLHRVDLRGATLRDANLRGVVLEKVKLGGADLRGADLSGATLDDVDLRGADLRGTRFYKARFRRVRLHGCRIEDACWNGADDNNNDANMQIDDDVLKHHIRQNMQRKPPDEDNAPSHGMPRRVAELRALSASSSQIQPSRNELFRGADLRATVIKDTPISVREINFCQADMRAVHLERVDFEKADLSHANLRAAHLVAPTFKHARLCGADLRAAVLTEANMERADMSGAVLRNTVFLDTISLHGAILNDADLSYGNMQGVYLARASLCRAQLSGAVLAGADLTNADLTDAICIHADFRNAQVTLAQLAQTARRDRMISKEEQHVLVLSERHTKDDSESLARKWLQLAHFEGIFDGVVLDECDLSGADLSGRFSEVSMQRAILTHARLRGKFPRLDAQGANLHGAALTGTFTHAQFKHANLTDARLSGVFFAVSFAGADLRGASLAEVSLVNVDLQGAQVEEAQLKQANRLWGCTMPDGDPYDGRFRLPGDLENERIMFGEPQEQQSSDSGYPSD
jgi:uncharacterized protein YjbI with pentapeptide repeats